MNEKRFRIGLNGKAVLFFLAVMVPNVLWYYFPAENDVLRIPSTTVLLDAVATVFQALFVLFMCLFVDKLAEKPTWQHRYILTALSFLALYYLSWVLYYFVTTHLIVIFALAVLPCLAFLAVEAAYQNRLATVPTIIFLLLHTVSSVIHCIQFG